MQMEREFCLKIPCQPLVLTLFLIRQLLLQLQLLTILRIYTANLNIKKTVFADII